MSMRNERKKKAAKTTTTDATTMRTVISTIVAVATALLLSNFTQTSSIAVQEVSKTVASRAAVDAASTSNTEPAEAPAPAPDAAVPASTQAPAAPAEAAPVATCAGEIGKYSNWNQNVAQAVMMAESGGNQNTVNYNISTGDHSIGCFQINLLDNNLYSKHRLAVQLGYTGAVDVAALTDWLKNPVNNVAIANTIYTLAGQWSDWRTTCATKVSCY